MPSRSDGEIPDEMAGATGRLVHPALLVVDLQHGDAHAESAYVARRRARDGDDAADYYMARIGERVVPNVGRLQAAFRERGLPVVFARIESLTADGRERSPDHVRRGIHFPPGSADGRILPDVAPVDGELVLSKTADDAFHGTGLGDLLGNMGAVDLVITGVVTGSCVLATALGAVRHGAGRVIVAADATAAWSDALQAAAEAAIRAEGADVLSTEAVLALFGPAQPGA